MPAHFGLQLSSLIMMALVVTGCSRGPAGREPQQVVPETSGDVLAPSNGTANDGLAADEPGVLADPGTEAGVDAGADAGSSAVEPGPATDSGSIGLGGALQITGMRTLAVVPSGSRAVYTVQEEFLANALERLGRDPGMATTFGSTSVLDGSVTLDFTSGTPEVVDGAFSVDISTLASDERRRDERIREDWLESGRYPIATFVPQTIIGFPSHVVPGDPLVFQLAGDLSIRDVTRPVTFDVNVAQKGEIRGMATTQILMTDFGFEPPSVLGLFNVADEVQITLELLLREQ